MRAGFSAQQVQKVMPEAVIEVDGILMLDLSVVADAVMRAKREQLSGSS